MNKIKFNSRKTEPKNTWESSFDKVLTPFDEFVHGETNSGILLVFCTIIALFVANSGWADDYHHFLETYLSIGAENFKLKMSIHHWINDGLMTLFFFLVGLEIKREILVGELSILRQALLPVCAAIGGMVVPALFYYSLNTSGLGVAGWGIPMATDIAFAVSALMLLGGRRPLALMTFLVALAIVDDMGAVLVIALFYTNSIDFTALAGAGVMLGALVAINLGGMRQTWVYAVIGFILWVFMYKSGIHATVAGILTAMAIPARPKYDPKTFVKGARKLLDNFDIQREKEADILSGTHMNGVLQTLETGINKAQTPLQNMEHAQHIPVNFLIIPIFALANAGVPVELDTLPTVLTDNVTLGVIFGLVLGKPIGIALASWLAVKAGICSLPAGVNMKHIIGVGFLAGIGFTMSIFIAELAFRGSPETLILAKTGILLASLLAAIIGFVFLFILGSPKKTGGA